MDELSNTVYAYYLTRQHELSEDRRFHFASRLYLWRRDALCEQTLRGMRAWFTHDEQPEEAIRTIIAAAKSGPVHGSKNAAALRRPYFEQYPMLKTYVSVLFRIALLYTIYGIDCRHLFHDLFPPQKAEQFARSLGHDGKAISILSTHAINFFYLYNGIILGDTATVDRHRFLAIGRRQYDRNDRIQLQLLTYLYTHCIIGDTLFYYRKLPDSGRNTYLAMLQELELLMRDRFNDINLDNKFEFLVCCRILGYSSSVESMILAEAGRSVSDKGQFLIDRYNANPQTENTTLDLSEHRNVLFIMANGPFTPIRQSDQQDTARAAAASPL